MPRLAMVEVLVLAGAACAPLGSSAQDASTDLPPATMPASAPSPGVLAQERMKRQREIYARHHDQVMARLAHQQERMAEMRERMQAIIDAAGPCVIDGITVEAFSASPHSQCMRCMPAQSRTEWTAIPDGSGCFDGNLCTEGDHCEAGVCVPGVDMCEVRRNCKPRPCVPGQCGWVDDGCGRLQNCRELLPCQPGRCWSDDGCGGKRYCECSGSTRCDEKSGGCVACKPETDRQMCTRLGRKCDVVWGEDNCGKDRVAQCGECPIEERDYSAPVDPKKVVRGVVVNQVVLSVKQGTKRAQVIELATSVGGRLVGQLPSIGVYQLEVPTRTLEELDAMIEKLKKNPSIEGATYNMMATHSKSSSSPRREAKRK